MKIGLKTTFINESRQWTQQYVKENIDIRTCFSSQSEYVIPEGIKVMMTEFDRPILDREEIEKVLVCLPCARKHTDEKRFNYAAISYW